MYSSEQCLDLTLRTPLTVPVMKWELMRSQFSAWYPCKIIAVGKNKSSRNLLSSDWPAFKYKEWKTYEMVRAWDVCFCEYSCSCLGRAGGEVEQMLKVLQEIYQRENRYWKDWCNQSVKKTSNMWNEWQLGKKKGGRSEERVLCSVCTWSENALVDPVALLDLCWWHHGCAILVTSTLPSREGHGVGPSQQYWQRGKGLARAWGAGRPPPPGTAWGAGGAATPVGTKGDPPAIVSVMCKCFVDNCLIINSAPC